MNSPTEKNNRFQTFLQTATKIAFSGGLLYWLIKADKLHLSSLLLLRENPTLLVILIAVWITGIFLCSLRWKFLLDGISVSKTYAQSLYITSVSSAFTSFLPGTMGSDVVKALYISKNQSKRGAAFFSIFLDRVTGFVGLSFLATMVSICNFSLIHKNASIQLAALSCCLMFLLSASFVLFLLFGAKMPLPKKLGDLLRKNPQFLFLTSVYANQQRAIFRALAISTVIHATFITGYICVTLALNPGPVPFFSTAILVALGVTFSSLPISPAGVGVGHFAFEELFSLAGLHNGANVFNIVFCTHTALNLLGFIPFLIGKRSETKSR